MGRVPVIYIYGESGSGKTRLVERMVSELLTKGVRVATVKLSRAEALDVDREGKDTQRHMSAGAVAVGATSRSNAAVLLPTSVGAAELIELVHTLGRADLVVVEGLGDDVPDSAPKILVGEAKGQAPGTVLELPDGDVELASLYHLVDRVREKKAGSDAVELVVGGREVPLKPFVQDYLEGTVRGAVGSLKGPGRPGDEITLRIPRRERPSQ